MSEKNPNQMGSQHFLVYYWVAVYKNKKCLPQFDLETGRENKFSKIDHSRLDSVMLLPFTNKLSEKISSPTKVLPLPIYRVQLSDKKRLILLRRNIVKFMMRSQKILKRKTVYLLGWQQTVNGRNVKAVMFIDEQGNVVLRSEI